jgi:hypothetical protein
VSKLGSKNLGMLQTLKLSLDGFALSESWRLLPTRNIVKLHLALPGAFPLRKEKTGWVLTPFTESFLLGLGAQFAQEIQEGSFIV